MLLKMGGGLWFGCIILFTIGFCHGKMILPRGKGKRKGTESGRTFERGCLSADWVDLMYPHCESHCADYLDMQSKQQSQPSESGKGVACFCGAWNGFGGAACVWGVLAFAYAL